jgi:hypothetical protein
MRSARSAGATRSRCSSSGRERNPAADGNGSRRTRGVCGMHNLTRDAHDTKRACQLWPPRAPASTTHHDSQNPGLRQRIALCRVSVPPESHTLRETEPTHTTHTTVLRAPCGLEKQARGGYDPHFSHNNPKFKTTSFKSGLLDSMICRSGVPRASKLCMRYICTNIHVIPVYANECNCAHLMFLH